MDVYIIVIWVDMGRLINSILINRSRDGWRDRLIDETINEPIDETINEPIINQ